MWWKSIYWSREIDPALLWRSVSFSYTFEGTFFTTVKTVFSRPGKLSSDYCNGIRKNYFKPLPLFILLVVLYLVFPIFSGLNTPFQFYLNKGSIANALVTKSTGTNIDSLVSQVNVHMTGKTFVTGSRALEYRHRYTDSLIRQIPSLHKPETSVTAKSEKISKISLLLLLPLTALYVGYCLSANENYFLIILSFPRRSIVFIYCLGSSCCRWCCLLCVNFSLAGLQAFQK